MDTRHKKYLVDLIEKYQSGIATDKEIEYLSNFYISHQESKKWPIDHQLKGIIKEKVFIEIKSGIRNAGKKDGKVRQLHFSGMLKYAAAILILVSTGYFLTSDNLFKDTSVIVDNNIEIGTDKATLTLDDGSDVALEKGQSYTAENVSSDGEQLIYNTTQGKSVPEEEKIAYNYLTIPRGGEFYVELEDGTKVWLNSESKIKYPVKFAEGKTREVELLYGEAYFDISPSTSHNGDKFKVLTQGQTVEVLGTEFNIKAYKNEETIATTLVEGKVAVEINNSTKLLIPSQQLNFNTLNNDVEIREVDTSKATAWRNGEFYFDNMLISDVMLVLERWYDVDISVENKDLQKLKFNGVLGKHQNIEIILLTLKNTKNISYAINENQITIN